ncbi:hypothetical protein ACFL3F_05300 [Planctomycetota bacterium]
MLPFIILGAVLVLGLVSYLISVSTRQSYRCPQCGETVRNVEHMQAQRCGMCGAPLEQKEY